MKTLTTYQKILAILAIVNAVSLFIVSSL